MPYFVGVDPSITNTGVTVLDNDGSVVGVYNSNVTKRTNCANKEISHYHDISEGIRNFIQPYSPELFIAYEHYSFGSTHRAFSLAEFGGILKLTLTLLSPAEIHLIPPTSVKKFATGIGTASKDRMIAQAKEESDYILQLSSSKCTSDVCDSYFLAKCAWYIYGDNIIAKEQNKDLLRTRLEMANIWKITQ